MDGYARTYSDQLHRVNFIHWTTSIIMFNTVTASVPFNILAVENLRLFQISNIDRWEPTNISGFEGEFFVPVFI
jgi:hypothetical protein